jgi:hypothetical protein
MARQRDHFSNMEQEADEEGVPARGRVPTQPAVAEDKRESRISYPH